MNLKGLLAPIIGLSLVLTPMATANVSAAEKPTVETKALELRSGLDNLLSEHYTLAIDTMVKTYDGDKGAKEAAKALDQNAKDMEPAIADIYGEDGAKQFEAIFAPHNMATDDYAQAVKDGDKQAQNKADKEVDKFVNDMAKFLDTATEGKLPEKAAKQALREHENDVQQAFDAYVDKDYKKYNEDFLKGYEQIFGVSKALSTAITTQKPEKFDNTKADTKAADLRSGLNMLISQHYALAVRSLNEGTKGSPDYDFVNWAQDQNTEGLKTAIGSVYGNDASKQFGDVWNKNHIAAQADLASATAADNKNGEDKAKMRLTKDFADEFSTFLSTATDNKLPKQAAYEGIMQHEKLVTMAFEQGNQGNYAASYKTWREGFAQTFDIGKALSNAIVMQHPDKFMDNAPTKMPNTGMGGAENNTSMITTIWVALTALILAIAGFITFRQVKSNK